MRRVLPVIVLLAALAVPPAAGGIVRGSPVDAEGRYPWQVGLYIDLGDGSLAQCGGSLIAPDVVLTAAHCTVGQTAEDFEVRGGSIDLPLAQQRTVVDVANHPDTQQDETAAPRYDVALLQLASPFGAPAAPVALIEPDTTVQGQPLTVTGWGLTDPDDEAYPGEQLGELTERMREAGVTGRPNADCSAAYGGQYRAADMLCASGTTPVEGLVADSCNGDSGGSLAWPRSGSADPADPSDWLLTGVVSWGSPLCGDPEAPGVYARLSAASLNGFALTGVSQPRNTTPPAIAGAAQVGAQLTCSPGEWANGPTSTSMLLMRLDSPSDTAPEMAGTTSHTLVAADAGRYFGCLETATNAGGSASQMSSLVGPVAPADPPPSAPPPAQQVSVDPPEPIAATPLLAAPDRTAPRSRVTSRRCRRRRCRLLVRVTDAGGAGAVRSLQARLTRKAASRTRRSRVRIRRLSSGLYLLRTRRLARARWRLVLRATDLAGNARRQVVRFRVR